MPWYMITQTKITKRDVTVEADDIVAAQLKVLNDPESMKWHEFKPYERGTVEELLNWDDFPEIADDED